MARSDYVYAVMSPDQIPPFATFTVKREMVAMVKRVEHDAPSLVHHLRVYRMDDGPMGMIAEMTVDDILNG